MPTILPLAMIREARLGDAGGIATVHVASWQATYAGLLPATYLADMSVEQLARRWSGILEQPGHPVFVAEEDGRVVGFASGGPERDRDPRYEAEVYAIYLLPEFQGRGLGRALIRATATALRDLGLRSLRIWVLRDNHRARGFYEHLGGRPAGEHQLDLGAGFSAPEVAYGWDDLEPLTGGPG